MLERTAFNGTDSTMLQKVEIFQGLSPEELAALESSSTSRSFPKNTVVIHENDPADSLFVIESGKVKVYCSDKNGKEFIMNTQGSGDYFGELALLDDSARSASVRTVEKSTFCIIYKEDFNRVLDEHPGIGRKLKAWTLGIWGGFEQLIGRYSFLAMFITAFLVAHTSNHLLNWVVGLHPVIIKFAYTHYIWVFAAMWLLQILLLLRLFTRELPTAMDNAYRHLNRADNLLSLRRIHR